MKRNKSYNRLITGYLKAFCSDDNISLLIYEVLIDATLLIHDTNHFLSLKP